MKRILPLLLALLMILSTACAETAEDSVIATVNGEELLFSDYYAIESAFLSQYQSLGLNLTDSNVYAYVQDLALTYAIEQVLIKQDMRAQGCYDFDEETENWFAQTGKAAYEAAVDDVKASLLASDPTLTEDELQIYALAYAESLNVTEQTYVEFYRTQYASAKYYEWLTKDNPVTDEDVQSAYAARLEESKALYATDIAAFETALSSGSEVWYKPEGYRSVLQILLPAEGDTDDAKLQSVQTTVDDIYARLEKGEAFEALIAEYGTDANFSNEAFLATGYQVHRESIIWEDAFVAAAFSAEMAQPGCWSLPLVSDLGVHILYYLCDSASGPIEMTEDIADALAYAIYTERHTAARSSRLDELAATAQIVFH